MASHNPPPWRNERSNLPQRSAPSAPSATIPAKRSADSRAHDKPAKRSANTTNAAEEAWVADEDRFVLAQAKKKAALRVKGGRAKPIDWLAVILRFVDPTKELLDDEVEDAELEVVDPEGVLEGLDAEELSGLEKEIENYLTLETNRSNRDYWNVCRYASLLPCTLLTFTGLEVHMQGPPPQVESVGIRRARHKLGRRRH
jgi:hypothetical protein